MLLPEPETTGRVPGRAAIVLAAGASTRLGQPKQLVRLGGKSLLRRAAEAAVGSGAAPVVVVLGRDADLLRPELAGLDVLPVMNPDWQEGMGSSLRCGIGALEDEGATAVLLMVCDQPRITAFKLKSLWDRYAAEGKVIAVRYGDHPGVPAIFPAKYVSELAKITGDQGARSLLGSLRGSEIELVDLPEAGLDLDTPDDLSRLAADDQNRP